MGGTNLGQTLASSQSSPHLTEISNPLPCPRLGYPTLPCLALPWLLSFVRVYGVGFRVVDTCHDVEALKSRSIAGLGREESHDQPSHTVVQHIEAIGNRQLPK